MTWRERFNLTVSTFKNIAFPLYFFYLVFFVLLGGMAIFFFFLPVGKRFLQFLEYLNQYQFDSFTPTKTAVLSSSTDIFRGDLFLNYLPVFIFTVVVLAVIGLIATSLLYTGVFHLAIKGVKGKALFNDFKFDGAGRMIGWNSFMLLLFVLVISVGIFLFAILSIFSQSISGVFATLYLVCSALVSIFIIPWILSGGYYVLAHRELSFVKALMDSWRFFRQNMLALWGAVLAMFLLNLVIVLIQEISSSVGGVFSFMATPFFSLIIIVWTITVMNERIQPSINHELTYTESTYSERTYDEPTYEDSPYHSNNEHETSIILDKPTEEESPLGYYHTWSKPKVDDRDINAEVEICSNCGTKVRANAIYCSKCGVKLR